MKSFIKSVLDDKVSITLDQLLKHSANEKSRGIYFIQYDGSELFESYEKLYVDAKYILGALQKQGFQQGSHIIFQTNNNLFFIRLFWGCILGGMIPVPLSVPLLASPDTEAFKKLVKVSKQLSNAWIISDKENLDIVREHYEVNNLNYIEYETLVSIQEEGQCVSIDCQDVAYIQYSSGSTGNPKGVKLTHKNLAYNLSQISERLKLQENDIMASWLPLTHDMGLIGYHLTPIFVGVSQLILNSVMFLKKSWLYFQKCTQLKATVLASPNFGLDWMMKTMKGSHLNNIDLSSVRNIMCGAEPISMDTIRQFYAKFSPYGLRENTIHQVYGMAEACVAITIPIEGHNRSVCINRHKARTGQEVEYVQTKEPNAAEFAIVGQPLDGIQLMIVDDEDHILKENYIGNIVIKGENVFEGYMNQDSSPFNELGFFYTGDLGFMRNGELIVMGRKKDILFVNGQNYYASDIENMLTLAIPQLSQVVVCDFRRQSASKDEIVVFVHDRHDVKAFLPLAHQVQNMVLERVGIAADYVIPIKTIPKTTSGKVQRYRLREQFENHEFDEVMAIAPYYYESIMESAKKSAWNKTEIENQIVDIAKDVFSITSLKVDDAISQLGVSSLTLIRFQDEINQRFQVEIPIVSLLKMSTLEQIIIFVEEQLKIEDVNKSELTGNKDMWYDPFPVTEIQGAYLVGRQNIMEMGNVSTHAYYEIETALDIKRLNDALNHVIEHQLMLRTIFDETGFQKVRRSISSYDICIEDLQDISSDEQQKRILEKRKRRSHFVFQQDHWPLFELSAFILGENRNYLFLDIDLLIADGGSLLILIQEITNYYEKPDMEIKPLAFQFSDYVRALQSFRETSAYQRDQTYWQVKIEDFAYAPQLPLVCEPETIEKPIFKRMEKCLAADKWNIVKSLATQHGVTPSVFLCTIYAEILCKWSNQSRMALNLTLFNRQSFHPDVMKLIGDFTSVLLLDIDLTVHRAFWERASMIQDILFEAVDHRFYSGVDVIRYIASKRELTSKAIMPIIFTSMLFDKSEFTDNMTKWGKIKYGISQTPQVFLDFQVTERDGQLLLTWDYVKDLFDEDMISAMFDTYQLRLQQVIDNNLASILLPWKQSKMLLDYNDTQGEYEGDLLQRLIDKQCQKTPDAIAVKLGQDTLTYGELARKSNQIAHYLVEQNYAHNSFIGVWAERRIETIVNLVAILNAGHAYIPINPEHPRERIEYIVEHSDIKLMLYPDLYEKENLSTYNDGALESLEYCQQDKAYVIYTSGSTGHPKGVVITQEAVVNTLLDINEKFKVDQVDKIIALSSMCFDLSVYDIFGALISGALLVLIQDLLDMDNIHQIMIEEEITIWNSVPAIMDMYMESTNQGTMKTASIESLRVVMLSGDWIPLGLPKKIKTRVPKAQVISLGGATEGSIWSIYFPIKEVKPEWKSIPYGYPLKNQQIYVLDEFGEECPVGVSGELHIGGKGVAMGYLNEEEKTKAAFIKHRLGYLYKTGDYGVMCPEGYVEFLGRRDSQVKIRGHRIELGEIEHCLNHLPKIRQSVVADYSDQQGEKRLCGYIVAGETLELMEIQKELAKYLPDYMVPAQLVQVDEIPLSVNGKVDRKLLPDPGKHYEEGLKSGEKEYEAPKTQTEKLVVEAFKYVLGMERVSVNDNFFDLGGDSIKAIHILNKIREAGYDSSMRNLLIERTPKLIAMNLSAKQEIISVEQGEISGEISLTPIQNYFFAQNMMCPEHFNVCQVFKVREKLDVLALQKVLSALVQHHDMLRATYKDKEQYIGKVDDKKWYGFTKIECESEEIKDKIKTTKVKMDLAEGPLLQAVLFCTPEQDYMLLTAHHIIMDVVSWQILSEDLEKGYRQALNHEEIILPAKTVSFKVWSEGLAHYSQSEKFKRRVAYWSEIENKLVDGKIKEDAIDKGFESKTAVACLSATFTEKLLKESAHAYNTEINDLLLTALGRAVYKVTGQRTLALQMEGHGREETVGSFDLGRTIGWFTSIYPVVLEELGTSIAQDIRNTKETLRRVPAHGIDYGIIKNVGMVNSEEMDVEASLDISFNYLGELGTKKESDNSYFEFSQLGYGQDTDSHNQFGPSINVIGHVQEGSLSITIICKSSRYFAEKIEQIGKAYEEELIAVAEHCSKAPKNESTASDFGERVWTDSEFCHVQEAIKMRGGEIQRIYPLTPMQEGMLYEKILDEASTKYVVQQTMRLVEVDVEKMHKAFEYLATQHDILRTKICYRGVSVPRQVLLKERSLEFNYMEVDNESDYLDLKEQDVKRGFELEEDTLIRMNIVKINNSEYRLIMTNYHIILDGWCLPILRKELFSAYMATDEEQLRLPKTASNKIGSYEKFVQYINEKDKEMSLKYWEDLLQGYETRADILPIGRPEETEEESQSQEFKLSLEVTEQAEAICAQYDVTLNTLVEACWGVLLEIYNLADDVVFGKVVSGRNAEIEGIEEIVGLFINTIPVRISTTNEDTFVDLLKSLQNQAIVANEHDFYSLAEIQNRTVLGRDLIGTLFFFEGYQGTSINIDGKLNVETEYYREQIGYDMGMTAFKSDSLHFRILFSTKKYNKEEINIIGSHLQRLMEQAIAAPQTKLNKLCMTNEVEEKKELVQFNATDSDYPRDKTIVQLFEEQVARTPDNIAVAYGNEELSYAKLNARANKLALKLRREYHIQPDDFVAIIAERSLEMVVGLYAILKAGAAYVPIDPFYPEERIKYILDDCQPKAVLTSHGEYNISPEKVVDLYSASEYEEDIENPEHVNTPQNLIYLVYTSGTTGKPKGVMVEHQNIVNQQIWTQREYPLHEGESLLMKTTCVFDVFAWEVFWWMLEGGKLVILHQGEESQSDKIIKSIQDYKVNAIQFVPSMFNMFLEELETSKEKINTLRYIINIGEKLNAESVRHYNQLREKGQVRAELLNLYGPAETTVNSSGYNCPSDLNVDKILIGKPISNTQIYIISNEKIAGIGVPGELCIAGESVSRGYLNREELTAQKFIKNPFGSGMMYKTGDLARWLPEGNIEYLGRIDEQVKIRGFRIEPGEIESTLLKLEGVSGAAVIVRQDKQGEKYLCAYVVVHTEEDLDEDNIKSKLRKKLPDYMIPAYIIRINQIPLSHNGKLDKAALPEPEYMSKEYVAPTNREETLVAKAFEKILGITEVSINDSFFDLGGHSLKATILCNELGKTIGIKLQLSEIFTLATPKRIGEKIRSLQHNSFIEIPQITKAEFYPMSSVQKRLYLLNEMVGPSISYNISNVIKYENTLDKEQLQGALDKLLEREEILRTSFHFINGEPVQMIQPDARVVLDYKEADTVDIQDEYDNFVCSFDLSKAPLMRVKLLQTPKASYLMLDIHHIVFDGESLPIMMNWINEFYEGHTLPMPRVWYKDFSAWQITQNITEQAAYWKNEFSGEIPILNLNTDFQRPKKMSFKGGDVQTKIEEPVCMELKELAKKHGATEFMIMLSTFMLLLSKYSQQEDIIVGTPISGRTHVDTQEMLGMFVNSLAIKGKVKQEDSFEQVLLGVKEKCLRGYDNQEFQYEDLIEAVDVKRDLSRNPLFDVMFMMAESEIMSGLKGVMSGTWVPMVGKVAKFDLNLMVIHTSEGYVVNLEYCTDLFRQETIKQMVDDYVSLLAEVVTHPENNVRKLLKKEDIMNGDIKDEEKDRTQAELNNRANHLEQEVTDLMQALYQRDQAYWKRKVENFPLAPQLPFLSKRNVVNNPTVKRLEGKISAKDWTIVRDKALDKKIAPSVLLCTIYGEVLCKWSNQSNMALNLNLFSSQPFHQDGMRLLGDFVSKLLLDIDLSSYREFWERASKIQNTLFESLDHRFYSGVDFMHDLAKSHGKENQALMPIIFTTMLRDEVDSFNTNMGNRGEFKYGINQTSQEFLTLQVMEKDGELLLTWDYVKDLFDEEMISAMFDTYQLRLQQVIENNLASMPLPLNQSKMLLDYNHTQEEYEGDLLQRLIDKQCQKTPDAIAVKLGQDTLTYGELARKSNQIANYLEEQNYAHNSFIGVWAERRIETIVNLVAILKAGHAYIPINPEHPRERIDYIVEHSDIKLMLHPDLYEKENLSTYNDGALESLENCQQDNAYVIYTSGSTGHPKGVVITQEAVVNTLLDINEKFKVGQDDKIIALSSMCFDLSVYDIFGALISGALLVLIPELLDMDNIHQIMTEGEITIWNSVPAIMDMYMESTNQGTMKTASIESLRVVMLSGDWIPLGLPKKIKTRVPKAQVISLGGATEGSIWSIYFPIKEVKPEWKSIPYGYPLKNQQIYVLDEFGEECPVGVSGELHIGGKGVAMGYLNEEEKTKAAFIKHRLGYLYKTGDYGVMCPEGYAEFLGRRDSQVKIRGHRIELGEIEHCLNHLPKIRQSVVADYSDQQGEKRLCGYIVADETVELTDIQKELAKYLPDYMVPAQLVQVDEIPLSTNGKVDRKLLPDPEKYYEESKLVREYEAPKTQTESLVAEAFTQVLGVDRVGITDSFFDLGGYSLNVIQLCNELEKSTGVRLPLKEIFDLVTPKNIAEKIKNSKVNAFEEIPQIAEAEGYSISSAQKRLYLLDQLTGPSITYNIPVVIKLKVKPDNDQLQRALDRLLEREEILRTSFHMMDGEPIQKIASSGRIVLEHSIVNTADSKYIQDEYNNFVQPFDLSKAPLMRSKILDTPNGSFLFLDIHHILCDAGSMPIMLYEIQEFYEGRELLTPRVQYKDFCVWQNAKNITEQAAYWKKEFSGDIPILDLMTDYPRPQKQSFKGANYRTKVEEKISIKVKELAKKYGATEFMVLLSTFMSLLGKYSRQEEIIVGTPILGRTHIDTQNMLGMFVNTLAIKGNVCSNDTFENVLLNMKEKCLKAYDNQEYQFEDLVEAVEVKRDFSRNPVFDVLFVLQDNDRENYSDSIQFGTWESVEGSISKFDLSLTMISDSEGYKIDFEYSTDLYKPETIEYMAKHFVTLLEEVVISPEKMLQDIRMIDTNEEEKILGEFNMTDAEYPHNKTIVQLFEEQAARVPNNIAITFEGQQLTYAQLNERANALARKLRKEYDIKPNDFVVILTEKCLEMMVGIYAILKAGAAYVPVDSSYPEDRINYIINDCKPKVALCGTNAPKVYIPIVYLHDETNYEMECSNLIHVNQSSDLMYIIYTSGTTGWPKGVMIQHVNVVRLFKNDKFKLDLYENDIWVQFHSYCFDVSVWELFGSMLNGAKLVIPSEDTVKDAYAFGELLQKEAVTILCQVPSPFYALIDATTGQTINSLRYIILAGEALYPAHLKKWHANNRNCRLINMYGPTETTVYATYRDIDDEAIERGISDIGKALPTLKIYMLNENELCGIGVPGELCITGDGVSQGYLNRQTLTDEKFVANPFGTGKMYRTGDLARWLPDGNIEYIGRMDDQAKIRGYRIEPREIESRLLEFEGISEVVVVVREDKVKEKYLCAYIIAETEIEEKKVKNQLKKVLPDYMVPAHIIPIDAIPLTRNGKLDRASLPQPEYKSKEYVGPRNDNETLLVQAFEQILGIENISVTDGFFDLGGSSLKAVLLCNELEKAIGVRLSLRDIFTFGTPEQIAEKMGSTETVTFVAISQVSEAEYYPTSSAQKRLYLLDEMTGPNINYNVSDVYAYEEPLDKERIQKALDKLLKQEEILRTSFHVVDGEPIQTISKDARVLLGYSEADTIDIQTEYDKFVQPFNLSEAPLMRVKLVKTTKTSYLFVDIHHIICDGESLPVILHQVNEFYENDGTDND